MIPAKDVNDPKLAELLKSIDEQDFPKEDMETLVITEGTSESAKAIGIRKAKGDVIGILASDNELVWDGFLTYLHHWAWAKGAAYPRFYYHKKDDNILNRYFALIGGNDPLAIYMKKNDRVNLATGWFEEQGTIGDNAFFISREAISKTDLDNYYHIDNALETGIFPEPVDAQIWHKTGGNIFKFFAKRYRYGLQHAFNKNRRWHLVDFRQPKDIMRLLWFILASLTIMHPLITSFRGWIKIKDIAWFFHPAVCLITVIVYSLLVIHMGLNHMFQSLFAPMAVQRA